MTGPATPGGGGFGPCPPRPQPFCVAKKNKGETQGEKRVSKKKLLTGCHQAHNVTVLAILESLKFQNVSRRPTMVADNTFQCSMAPPLRNPFRRPYLKSSLPKETLLDTAILLISILFIEMRLILLILLYIFIERYLNRLTPMLTLTISSDAEL